MQRLILIVDDLIMIHRIVGNILKEAGYKVLKADNGRKGYEMAKTWKPDLVIMDIEMPVMDGIEATRLIKTDPEVSGIPVVMLTSLGSEEDIKRAYDAGANRFLNKPVSKDDLLTTVNGIVGKTAL